MHQNITPREETQPKSMMKATMKAMCGEQHLHFNVRLFLPIREDVGEGERLCPSQDQVSLRRSSGVPPWRTNTETLFIAQHSKANKNMHLKQCINKTVHMCIFCQCVILNFDTYLNNAQKKISYLFHCRFIHLYHANLYKRFFIPYMCKWTRCHTNIYWLCATHLEYIYAKAKVFLKRQRKAGFSRNLGAQYYLNLRPAQRTPDLGSTEASSPWHTSFHCPSGSLPSQYILHLPAAVLAIGTLPSCYPPKTKLQRQDEKTVQKNLNSGQLPSWITVLYVWTPLGYKCMYQAEGLNTKSPAGMALPWRCPTPGLGRTALLP